VLARSPISFSTTLAPRFRIIPSRWFQASRFGSWADSPAKGAIPLDEQGCPVRTTNVRLAAGRCQLRWEFNESEACFWECRVARQAKPFPGGWQPRIAQALTARIVVSSPHPRPALGRTRGGGRELSYCLHSFALFGVPGGLAPAGGRSVVEESSSRLEPAR